MKRRIFIIIGVTLIVGAGIFLTYWYFKASAIQTKEFAGNLQSIKGDSIFVKGEPFLTDTKIAQSIGIGSSSMSTVEIIITADTKITRTTFHIPTADELKKTNGMFEPDKLPREQSAVGLDTLENDFKTTYYTIGVRAVSAINVIGQQKFTAKQIEYIFPVQ